MAYKLIEEVRELQQKAKVDKNYTTVTLRNAILTLLREKYQKPDDSHHAQYEFFNDLYKVHSDFYDAQIYSKKTLWGKIIAFFGYVSDEEKACLTFSNQIKQKRNEQEKLYSKTWGTKWYHFFINPDYFLQFFRGISLNSENEMDLEEHQKNLYKLSNPYGRLASKTLLYKMKVIYHRLMGNSPTVLSEGQLEGIGRGMAAYKLTKDLERFQKKYKRNLTPAFQQAISEALGALKGFSQFESYFDFSHVAKQINTSLDSAQLINEISYRIKKAILQLPAEQKCLVPAGYSSESSGHAVVIEFYRNKDNTLKMSVVNTGDGVVGHAGFIQKIVAAFTWKSGAYINPRISEATLLQTNLLESLFKSMSGSSLNDESACKIMTEALKECHLEVSDKKYPLQNNGTCAYSSLLAWLMLNFEDDLFSAFQHFVIDRSLGKLSQFQNSQQPEVQRFVSGLSGSHGILNKVLKEGGGQANCKGKAVLTQIEKSAKAQKTNIEEKLSKKVKSLDEKVTKNTKELKNIRKNPTKEKLFNQDYLTHLSKKVATLEETCRVKQGKAPGEKPTAPGLVFFPNAKEKEIQATWDKYVNKQRKVEYVQKIIDRKAMKDFLSHFSGFKN